MTRNIFIVYDSGHVEEARVQATRAEEILCLDYLAGQSLIKENIPFISLRDVIDSNIGEKDWWELAQDVSREWYRLPALQFFHYRGIRIGEVLEPIVVEAYLARLFYFARVYKALEKAYPGVHFTIPLLVVEEAPTDDCLISFERRAVADAARLVGLSHTIISEQVIGHRLTPSHIDWKRFLIRTYNVGMGLLPRRTIKIYASEHWSHIGPVMEQMDDCELVLLDNGGELKHIPWRQLLKHRIRTWHPSDVIRDTDRGEARQASNEYMREWKSAKTTVVEYLVGVHGELDWSPVLEAFEYLMSYAPRVMNDIDALHRIMTEEQPDVVLQIASVSGRYLYFYILAHIARELGIPSVELQHASAYIDPRVVYSRIETDYLASYGATTNVWHERLGHARQKLVPVGSTRFDHHRVEYDGAQVRGKELIAKLGLDPARPILLIAVPYISQNLFHFDSYEIAEMVETVRLTQSAVLDLQILFKCRGDKFVERFKEYLSAYTGDYAVAGDEDIFPLICASDAVACGSSTILYQAMLAKKPLVLYPWKAYDTYRAEAYMSVAPLAHTSGEAVNALTRILTDTLYRDELLARQAKFLEGFSFDGRSTERIVELMQRLAKNHHARSY